MFRYSVPLLHPRDVWLVTVKRPQDPVHNQLAQLHWKVGYDQAPTAQSRHPHTCSGCHWSQDRSSCTEENVCLLGLGCKQLNDFWFLLQDPNAIYDHTQDLWGFVISTYICKRYISVFTFRGNNLQYNQNAYLLTYPGITLVYQPSSKEVTTTLQVRLWSRYWLVQCNSQNGFSQQYFNIKLQVCTERSELISISAEKVKHSPWLLMHFTLDSKQKIQYLNII